MIDCMNNLVLLPNVSQTIIACIKITQRNRISTALPSHYNLVIICSDRGLHNQRQSTCRTNLYRAYKTLHGFTIFLLIGKI